MSEKMDFFVAKQGIELRFACLQRRRVVCQTIVVGFWQVMRRFQRDLSMNRKLIWDFDHGN